MNTKGTTTGGMGWRAWNAYEREAEERWRALPWREGHPLQSLVRMAVLLAVAIAFLYACIARSAPSTPRTFG